MALWGSGVEDLCSTGRVDSSTPANQNRRLESISKPTEDRH